MNEKFYSLPEEKQQAMLQAAYRVFSRYSYKKSPMREIADAAGISKALLFHYFRNKRELYLYLWDRCAAATISVMDQFHCYEDVPFFTQMERGMRAKINIMRQEPDMAGFAIRAYYEEDPAIRPAIQESLRRYLSGKAKMPMLRLKPEEFRPGLDLQMMYKQMYWAADAFSREVIRRGPIDPDRLERDFTDMVAFWKQAYGRKEEESD